MNVAIIVAAGRGERAGAGRAKQFREVSGIPIIIHTLSRFELCESVAETLVVSPADSVEETLALVRRYRLKKTVAVVAGGTTRAESVERGLRAVGSDVEVVAVHDGVRPFVTPAEIDSVVREAEKSGAAILAAPVIETIKEVERGLVARTPERARLWRAQTPQCFRLDILLRAYEQASRSGLEATDDSSLVERSGVAVSVIEGGPHNIKITTALDFAFAEILMKDERFGFHA